MALLPDHILRNGDEKGGPYYVHWDQAADAKMVTNDGRVMLALMERVAIEGLHTSFGRIGETFDCYIDHVENEMRSHSAYADNLCPAICEACCDALESPYEVAS